MFYFLLPNMYTEYAFNDFLIEYLKNNEDKTNFQARIEMVYGNYPFSFWGGDENNNEQAYEIVTRKESLAFVEAFSVPICIDMGNIYLLNEDIYDRHLNMVIETLAYKGNYVRLSNSTLLNYINDKHFGYKFIASSDDIVSQSDIEKFDYFEIPAYMNQYLATEVPYTSTTIITLGNKCQFCPKDTVVECRRKEHQNQILFSTKSILKTCANLVAVDMLEELKILQTLGYNRFKISPTDEQTLIEFFIKPEYQDEFRKEYEATL